MRLSALALATLLIPTAVAYADDWKMNGFVTPSYTISGTGDRNNPLRRSLDRAIADSTLFVRFRLRYEQESIDTPGQGDGEFIVLWLDENEGNSGSTHSSHVPNIGIHVQENANRFMVRYNSASEAYGPRLEGNREYLIVGRLKKSSSNVDAAYDELDLWVDPTAQDKNSPDASVSDSKAISRVLAMGFSTGRKTEPEDRIQVHDISLGKTWEEILGLPATPLSVAEDPVPTIDFARDVLPILKERCFACHAKEQSEGDFRVDLFDETLNQVTPGHADQSRLYTLVLHQEMPPEGDPLSKQDLATLAAWINEGLAWNHTLLPSEVPQSNHWAFQPLIKPEIPQVENKSWLRTPVDAFVAQMHQQHNLHPNPPADTATLHRRMSLDMLGLPVAEIQIDGPLEINQLLTDPAHGERYARHWLDVARFGESNGHQHNRARPHAWRYRDWVVNAINGGLSYDRFLRDQIAGDLVSSDDSQALIATGFLAAARYSGNELDKEIQRNDILADIANTTTAAFMGLTFECAQCHTHKFDPISIRDYYRFQAFFVNGQPGNIALQKSVDTDRLVERRWEIFNRVRQRLIDVKRRKGHPEPIYVIPKSVVAGMRANERNEFKSIEARISKVQQTWGYFAPQNARAKRTLLPHEMRWPLPRDIHTLSGRKARILVRGDIGIPGPVVTPGLPLLFHQSNAEETLSRLDLAQWLTSRENPLTARVWVNRLWQWHFGQGLVATSNDFGTQGALASNQALLDFLATELIENQWDTRHIHRLILDSATYRQSSADSAENMKRDPDNHWLWRWTPRRLEAEAIRDSILAVSGQLDRTSGGPSSPHDAKRRSLYLRQERDRLPIPQTLFDASDGNVSCGRRRTSTNALQPLWLLNSPFMQEAANRLSKQCKTVEEIFLRCLHRVPTDAEREQLVDLEQAFGLQSVALAVLNSSEFIYLP